MRGDCSWYTLWPFCNISIPEGAGLEWLRGQLKGLWKCQHGDLEPGKSFRIPLCSGGSCVYCLNTFLLWFILFCFLKKIGDEQAWLAVFPPHCSPILRAVSDFVCTWINTHSSKLHGETDNQWSPVLWTSSEYSEGLLAEGSRPSERGRGCRPVFAAPRGPGAFARERGLLRRSISQLRRVEIFRENPAF